MKRKLVLCLALAMGLSVTAPLNNFSMVNAQEELQRQLEENDYAAIRNAVESELIGSVQDNSDGTLNETLRILDENVDAYLKSWVWEENMTEADDLFNDSLFLENAYGARVTESLNRLKKMAIQYHSKSSKYYQDENIKDIILKGLDFIVSYKYNSTSYYNRETSAWYFSNWWDEEIGTPKALVDTIVLMYEEVSDYGTIQVKKLDYPSKNEFEESTIIDTLTDAMNRYIKDPGYRFRWDYLEETGANLLDKVAITIKYASVVDDDARYDLPANV